MYPNLRAEMVRKNVTCYEIAKHLKISTSTLSEKLNGRSDFKLSECKSIIKYFFPDSTLEYLFEYVDLNQKI